MRQSGRRPTRKEKEYMMSKKLNPDNWLVRKNTTRVMEIIHRETGRAKVFEKVR